MQTTPYSLNSHLVVRLPKELSARLPSRGQVMVSGQLNGHDFLSPLEPDGQGGHWFEPSKELRQTAQVSAGTKAEITVQPSKEWCEPEVPADLQKAINANPKTQAMWQQITPMARWEWVRSTRSDRPETRKRRVEVACSKMLAGKRRPCCWNRNLCTETAVSKSGVLLGP